MIGSLEDALNAEAIDLTVNGECVQCGQCCGSVLIMSEDEIKRIHKYIKTNRIKACVHFLPFAVQPPIDLTCPFLDTYKKKEKCRIYEVRPNVCRAFICSRKTKDKEAETKLFAQRNYVVDMWKEFFPHKK